MADPNFFSQKTGKRFRVHCWVDLMAVDEENALASAQVSLAVMQKTFNDIVAFGTPGQPVDLVAMQKRNKMKKASTQGALF